MPNDDQDVQATAFRAHLLNKKLAREIGIILVVKVIVLLTIKQIWFSAPTIPVDNASSTAQHISGTIQAKPSASLDQSKISSTSVDPSSHTYPALPNSSISIQQESSR